MLRRSTCREAIRENIHVTPGVQRFDPVTDTEVEYLKTMEEQAELADFDRYVQTLINPRKPGNMKFLMEIYPQFVERRIQQAHTDYSYAIRKQMIDQWGVNTFDDLHFLYLMDQGKVAGPTLSTPGRNASNKYQAGWLAPGAYKRERNAGIRLPFASAQFGESAGTRQADGSYTEDPAGWTMSDAGQALAGGRNQADMAAAMYQRNPQLPGGGEGPNAPAPPRRDTAGILSRL